MSDSQEQSVIRRKARAGKSSTAIVPMSPSKALHIAIPKAGMSANGLQLAVTDLHSDTQSLAPLLDALPTRGLFLRLDGPNASNGYAIVDAGLLSAIIEMQTMGRVATGEVVDRRPTSTDAIISEEIINDCLATFAAALTGMPDWGWAQGYKVAGKIDGARALGMLLEDVAFRTFEISIEIAGGERTGTLKFGLPAQGRGAGASKSTGPDDKWKRALLASISQAPACLSVVLHRHAMPLSQVDRLRVGELLTLPMEAMGEVRLETESGECAAIGRLGQIRGMRAIKLTGAVADIPEKSAGEGYRTAPDKPPALAAQDNIGSTIDALPELPNLPNELDAAPLEMPELPELPQLPDAGELPELPELPQLP